MNFLDIHEQLRLELQRRIDRGVLSGTLLARQTGFRQAHISNVLNSRRFLSLEGVDRVLAAQDLSIEQILLFQSGSVTKPRPRTGETMPIPIVSSTAALHQPQLVHSEILHVPTAYLRENRSRPAPLRANWERYLAITLNPDQAEPMQPMLTTGSHVVIDRLYTSLASYRAPHPTLYAVNFAGQLLLRFVSLEDGHLILRPNRLDHPVRLLRLGPHDTPADYIIGRACLLLSNL